MNIVWKLQIAHKKTLSLTKNTTKSSKFEDRHVIQESTLNNRSTTNFQDEYITLHASTASKTEKMITINQLDAEISERFEKEQKNVGFLLLVKYSQPFAF